MTTAIDICNLSLSEIGSRIAITSFSDNTPQAQACALNYTPRAQALSRAVLWDYARAQQTLTVWKQALVNGVTSSNPPPQPWLFSYLRPPDCLRARFVLPTIPVQPAGVPLTTTPNMTAFVPPAPTGIPFVIATDLDANNNPINVILTNLPFAQLIYTRDLTQYPGLWDAQFTNAFTAYLGCYLINALARNQAQLRDQISMTKSLVDEARIGNGNEGIGSIDRVPDWVRARMTQGFGGWGAGPVGGFLGGGGWGGLAFPGGDGGGGLRY